MSHPDYMTAAEVAAAQPLAPPANHEVALGEARRRMIETGQWSSGQFMGRRWPIGCVALEITQRCNLDCTACYLSEHSEAVADVPLEEIFRRIDLIAEHYGPNTDVQVTGGDPTLRRRTELIDIVRRIREKGMRPSLFTNGIRAKRDLLRELADVGLVDVAFHVDLTQQRKGYESELALNTLRQEYIERVRGLPLSVLFNTTLFEANIQELPGITASFVRNSDIVRFASFQIQAETGRGMRGCCGPSITLDSVAHRIEQGAGTSLSFESTRIGHSKCNRFAMTFVTNGKVYDALDDTRLVEEVLDATACLAFNRHNRADVVRTFVKAVVTRPRLWVRGIPWLLSKVWQAKRDLLAARGQVNKLSFFIHHFMDACRLEKDRINACGFSVMTHAGPISMCLHNAKRDAFILQPIALKGPRGERFWDPVTGTIAERPPDREAPLDITRKTARGRLRQVLSKTAPGSSP